MTIKKDVDVLASESEAPILDRSRLHNRQDDVEVEEEGGSMRAIVVLVLIIVVVAVGGAYLIKSIRDKDTANTVEPTPTPTESEIPVEVTETPIVTIGSTFVSSDVLDDSLAEQAAKDEKSYIKTDKDFPNTQSNTYTLSGFAAQPYSGFYRLTFTFLSSDDKAKILVPSTKVNYRGIGEEIELTFSKVSDDTSGVEADMPIDIKASKVASVVRVKDAEVGSAVYQIKLNGESGYYAQVIGDQFVIDVMEANAKPTTEVTPTDSTATPSPMATSSANFVENIKAEGQKATLKGFTFGDAMDKFTYQIKIAGDNVPKVSSKQDADGTITIRIENVATDSNTKDGSGYFDFVPKGVVNVLDVKTTFANGVSEYVIKMSKKADYTVRLDDVKVNETDTTTEKRIVVEIMQNRKAA